MLNSSGFVAKEPNSTGIGFEIPDNPFFNASQFNELVETVINGTVGNITFVSFNTSDVKKIMRATIEDLLNVKVDLKIKEIIESPLGKWPENLGSVIFMEKDNFFDILRGQLETKLNKALERVI